MKKTAILACSALLGSALLLGCDDRRDADNTPVNTTTNAQTATNAQTVTDNPAEGMFVPPENAPADAATTTSMATGATGAMNNNLAMASASMNLVTLEGTGKSVGSVTFKDTDKGLEASFDLMGLTPGQHGFHVHQNGDCGPGEDNGQMVAAGAAGGHYDPANTGKHLGPHGGGHMGDLPVLNVNPDGSVSGVVKVDGVKVADFKGRALIIHEGGDNYHDYPEALGGGGARIACGIIR